MTALPAREIASMQKVQATAMPDQAAVTRTVRATDGFGGFDEDSTLVIFESVACRITKAQVQEFRSGSMAEVEKWTVRLPIEAEGLVKERDLIYWMQGDLTIEVDEIKPRTYATVVTVMGERVH